MVAQLDKRYVQLNKEKAIKRFFSYLLFEGRPHTTKGQWFNPVVFSLLKLLGKLPGEKALNKPVFITGLGRSGTTVLGLIMSMHKDLAYLNEPKAIWSLIDPQTDTVDDYVQSKGQYNLLSSDVDVTKRTKAGRIFGRYLNLIGRSRLLDKYPEHIFRVDYLLSVFPDAKIIFISRAGNDAVASIAKWSQDHGQGAGNDLEDWWGRCEAKWHYLCDQVLTQSRYQSILSGVNLAELNHINRAALEWVVTMDAGLTAKAQFKDQMLHVRYESLLENPKTFFDELSDFCELSEDSQMMEYANSKVYQQTPKPMPDLLVPVRQLFEETMKNLDYPMPDSMNAEAKQ